MNNTVKPNRLGARDLISLGIFSAIAVALYLIITSILRTTLVGWFFSTAGAYLCIGVVYMLMAAIIKKRGTFLIAGIIIAGATLITGHIYLMLGHLVGAILSELIVGKYNNKARIFAAYIAFAVCGFCGIFVPAYTMGTDFMIRIAGRFGVTAELLDIYIQFFSMRYFFVLMLINASCALASAYIGSRILKKHFEKAGLINTTQKASSTL